MQEEIQWRLGHKLHIEEFSICIPNISVLKEESLSNFSMRAQIVLIERNSSSIYEGYDQIFDISIILKLRRMNVIPCSFHDKRLTSLEFPNYFLKYVMYIYNMYI